jgi:hypothetical protein
MSAAWSVVWFGSMPITVRLRTSRRTLSSLVCSSASVGLALSKLRRWIRRGMRFFPKTSRDFQGIHSVIVPPRAFIAGLVQLPVMPAAKRDRELITHLETNGSRLCEPQVMGIGRLPAADEARLSGNEFQVCLVA